MTPPDFISVVTLVIALTLLHLATIIHVSAASSKGSIGDYCQSYKDCQQEKLLICTQRSTCDCAFKSTFSAIQQKCVRHVGERCILSTMDNRFSGPLPEVGCVDNAKCVHKQGSGTPFNHGLCECLHGFYRTEESFCFKHPDPPAGSSPAGSSSTSSGSSSSNNNKSPSLSSVLNSIPNSYSDSSSKPAGGGGGHHHYSNGNSDRGAASPPPPYHHPLTRSSSSRIIVWNQFTIIMSSLVIFLIAIAISS